MAEQKKLSLYDMVNQLNKYKNLNMPLPQESQPIENNQINLSPQQQSIPINQINMDQGLKRPEIPQELLQQGQQELLPKQGWLARHGITPSVITNLAAGITALTGGSGYLASGLANAGQQAGQLEAQQEETRKARLIDYIKGLREEQKDYDRAKMIAERTFELQRLENEKLQQKQQENKYAITSRISTNRKQSNKFITTTTKYSN